MLYHLELETIQNDKGRKYIVGDNHYDSVTTVTGFLAKESIEKWKNKIGRDEADRICKESSTRGTELHSLCENHFKSNLSPDEIEGFRDDTKSMFESIKPHLSRIDESYAIETCLYSDWLKLAGRTDLIGVFEGVPSVVDFKTSRKPKKREWIDNYFAQLAIYSFMFKERTGISLEQLVILMVSVNGQVQTFKETITQCHYDNMFKFIDFYRKQHD